MLRDKFFLAILYCETFEWFWFWKFYLI
jgi:hypothetical protein